MPTFDFMTLLWWGLPFAAAPVIIHLINLLRHRVVRWPAMEFLLASQRKYRTRILLKQTSPAPAPNSGNRRPCSAICTASLG
jgi:hypothetical protein